MIRGKYMSLVILMTMVLFACGCQAKSDASDAGSGGKLEVTMMYPMKLEHFEALVEKELSDIDLQVELTTTATLNGDSERRLRNGHGTDLVVTTLPTGAVKDYMMDLSAESFSTNYQGSVASPVMIEGQTRYLPLPGQYSGYIINKTFVDQLGLTMPGSNTELTELCEAGKAKNIGVGEDGVMIGLTVVAPSSVGTFIIGTQVPDFLGTASGIQWSSDFDGGTAGFLDAWNDSLDLLLTWVERGYLNSATLSLKAKNAMPIEERMLDGTLMLSHGNVQLLTKLNSESQQYEYVMIPYLSDEGNHPWVTSEPDGYIGINAALSAAEDSDRLDACIRVLSLLSTPEGQAAWMADTQAPSAYLLDHKTGEESLPEGIAACVTEGYIYDIQMPSNVVQYFGKSMISVLDGTLEMGAALAAVDDYCQNGSTDVDYDQTVVGSVAEDLLYENYNTRREETLIGNLVSDAVREYAKTDMAVVNGGGIRASLYKGDVLGADLSALCPYDNTIVVVEVTGEVIHAMLENSISLTTREAGIPAGRFLQVSGIAYTYRPADETNPPKLLSVTMADGSPLDPDAKYSLAITNYMAGSGGYMDNNGDGYTMLNIYSDTAPKAENVKLLEETGATYSDALKQYFYEHRDEPVKVELEGRITVAGNANE